MDSTTYCIVPVFGPALDQHDYVIEYIKRVLSKKAIKSSFVDMYNVIANPGILTDDDMWKIMREIIEDFNYLDDNAGFKNAMWSIFERADAVILQKLTGFMLRQFGSTILTRLKRSSGLKTVMVVPSQASVLLQQILSWVWVPVLIRLEKSKAHASFCPTSLELFHTYKDSILVLPEEMPFEIWGVKKEWKAAAMNEISSVIQHTTFWDDYKKFISRIKLFPELVVCREENQSTSLLSLDSLQSSLSEIMSEHSLLYSGSIESEVTEGLVDSDSDTTDEGSENGAAKHSDGSFYR